MKRLQITNFKLARILRCMATDHATALQSIMEDGSTLEYLREAANRLDPTFSRANAEIARAMNARNNPDQPAD